MSLEMVSDIQTNTQALGSATQHITITKHSWTCNGWTCRSQPWTMSPSEQTKMLSWFQWLPIHCNCI